MNEENNQVLVKFHFKFQEQTGTKEILVPWCQTIRILIESMKGSGTIPFFNTLLEGGKLNSGLLFLLNGRNVLQFKGADTALEPGDELAIFPALAGG